MAIIFIIILYMQSIW